MEKKMAVFKSDLPIIWLLSGNPLVNAIVGFVVGYLFIGEVVFTLTGLVTLLLIVAFIDIKGRELDSLFVVKAIFSLAILLLVMWVTVISVNHWWTLFIPEGILRK